MIELPIVSSLATEHIPGGSFLSNISTNEHLSLDDKYSKLRSILQELGSVVIGFSAGVDSTLLLKVARLTLGRDRVLAVVGISETYPERELLEAMHLIELIDVEYETTRTEETDELKFQQNPPDRCYYCKTELYGKLSAIRDRVGFDYIVDGTNADDTREFRPGLRALREKEVRSPLAEAGLTKSEIRQLSAQLELPTADKPSFACLSSRFPYGMGIDKAKLKTIDAAENALHDLGFRVVRVRYHDDRTARIEVSAQELALAVRDDIRIAMTNTLRTLGFTYITLDLNGFRSGSMNEVLTTEEKNGYLNVASPISPAHSSNTH